MGTPGWLSGLKPLPSAQVMIPGPWDQACTLGSLLSGEPASSSLSACLSDYLRSWPVKYKSKIFKKNMAQS